MLNFVLFLVRTPNFCVHPTAFFNDAHRGRRSNFYHRLSNLTSVQLQLEVARLLTAVDGGDNSDVCVGLLLHVRMRTLL